MMRPGASEPCQTGLREGGERGTSVERAWTSFDETGPSHVVDHPCDSAWRQVRSTDQLGHVELPVGRRSRASHPHREPVVRYLLPQVYCTVGRRPTNPPAFVPVLVTVFTLNRADASRGCR